MEMGFLKRCKVLSECDDNHNKNDNYNHPHDDGDGVSKAVQSFEWVWQGDSGGVARIRPPKTARLLIRETLWIMIIMIMIIIDIKIYDVDKSIKQLFVESESLLFSVLYLLLKTVSLSLAENPPATFYEGRMLSVFMFWQPCMRYIVRMLSVFMFSCIQPCIRCIVTFYEGRTLSVLRLVQ